MHDRLDGCASSPGRAPPPARGGARHGRAASRAGGAPARSATISSTAATRLATRVAVRQGRIRASAASGASIALLDSLRRLRAPVIQAQVRASPSSSETRGRQPSSRSISRASSTERCTSPSRAGSCRGAWSMPATRAHAACRSATVVSRPVPTLYGPPARPTAASSELDDVVDVDEVARLRAVAEDHGRVASRQPLEEDRDDAALEPGVLPRPVDVRESEGDVVRAVDAVPAGQVLLAALLRDAVRREGQERRLLRGGLGALAVARAAGGGEDHLGSGRGGEHVDGADDVDRRVVVRAAASTSARRPAPRGGRRRRPRPRTARGCRARAGRRPG